MPKSQLKPPKVVKTQYGWEPSYWSKRYQCYFIEPGFARSTRVKAEELLTEMNNFMLIVYRNEALS